MFYRLIFPLLFVTQVIAQPTPSPTPLPVAEPTIMKKIAADRLEASLNEKLLEKEVAKQKKQAAKIAARLAAAQKKAAARKKIAHAAIDDLRTQLTTKELSVSELEKQRLVFREQQQLISAENLPADGPVVTELMRQRNLLLQKIRKNNNAFHCKVLHIGCISESGLGKIK